MKQALYPDTAKALYIYQPFSQSMSLHTQIYVCVYIYHAIFPLLSLFLYMRLARRQILAFGILAPFALTWSPSAPTFSQFPYGWMLSTE